ncbi:MAG: hypothetical protein AAB116_18275 [Candidatus Poribacteria bacterium]
MKNSEFCYFHNADVSGKRKESQSKGGANKRALAKIENLDTISDIKGAISQVLAVVCESRQNLLPRARIAGYLAGVLSSLIEGSDFEHRLSEIEKRLDSNETNNKH